MTDSTMLILNRLSDLGFETRVGKSEPFGEVLPLVTGTAWNNQTAQVAYIAEYHEADDVETWRQLLFAGSGLRHQLAGSGPTCFGTPVILAIVDGFGEQKLRQLAEDLIERYALFRRVDLNLVRRDDLMDAAALDLALAPLLPTCRSLLGSEISKREVRRFWEVLRSRIVDAATELDDTFGEFRDVVGTEVADRLVGDIAGIPALPSPTPLKSLEVSNFRSFKSASVEFAPISVIHGPNGSGKSSLLEALELSWAESSQRQPADVDSDEYARHLPHDGIGRFAVVHQQGVVDAVSATPKAELQRCVLTQEAVSDLVRSSPRDRYSGLLTATGLEIPDLRRRTGDLVSETKREADSALVAAGLAPLPRSDSVALRHLTRSIGSDFVRAMPPVTDLNGIESSLAAASSGAFQPRGWEDEGVATLLAQADALTASVLSEPDDGQAIAAVFSAALIAAESAARRRHDAARATRVLLDAVSLTPARKAREPQVPAESPIAARLAARWIAHSQAVGDAAAQFRTDAAEVEDEWWSNCLLRYSEALDRAVGTTPLDKLRLMATRVTASAGSSPVSVPTSVYESAGFTDAPPPSDEIISLLRDLADELQRQAHAIDAVAEALKAHPAQTFAERSHRVLRALCRFELARILRREGPIARASEELVSDLLQGVLAPVLRELVAAIVRFEWYFKPLTIPDEERRVILGGLATSAPDLDARLVLNSAERHVVGVAWFLALHMLQPPERRQVLVLDDPPAGFDSVNQAGFVATLRALVRLIRPAQLVVATHDDGLAAVLAEELAPVDGWPSATARMRCRRDSTNGSTVAVEWSDSHTRTTDDEAVKLGLRGEATLFA